MDVKDTRLRGELKGSYAQLRITAFVFARVFTATRATPLAWLLMSDGSSLATGCRDCCSVTDGAIRHPGGGLPLIVYRGGRR